MRRRIMTAAAALAGALALAGAGEAQTRAERAEAYVRSHHELGRFNGAALVVDRGEVLVEEAYGFVDAGTRAALTPDIRFRIGPITQSFTAALVLRLVEAGELELDAPVARYIEAYPRPQGDRITIHHLLSHTSGLPSYTNITGFLEERGETPLGPAEIVAITWEKPLDFEPGTDFARSSSGYVLLGWIVERVTGRSYPEALRTWVLDPLRLEDTGYDGDVMPPAGHARGHDRTFDGYEPASPLDPSLPYAADMLYSTVGDLHAWASTLLGWDPEPRLFARPETASLMRTPNLGGYGYGLAVETRAIGRDDSVLVVGHTGGIVGFSSVLRAFPEQERLIVLLDNTSSDLRPIADGLTNLLWGAEAVPPKPSIAERILPIVESAGVEAALERYRHWRHTRPDRYRYGPEELLRLARHLYETRGDTVSAIAILEAQAEEAPELPAVRHAISGLLAARGDTAAAIVHMEEALTYAPGAAPLLARVAALGGEPDPALRAPRVEASPGSLAPLEGRYRVDPSTELVVELVEGRLMARRTGEPAFELIPQSDATFLLRGSSIQLVFEVGPEGATAVSVLEAGRRVRFPRVPGAP